MSTYPQEQQIETCPPELPPEASKRLSFSPLKLFLLILLIIGIVLIGGYSYWQGQNTDSVEQVREVITSDIEPIPSVNANPEPTPAVKTYTNVLYHYSFNYPSELSPYRMFDQSNQAISNPENADRLSFILDGDEDNTIFSIGHINSPTRKDFKNEAEAAQETFDYFSTSTSSFLSPELNQIEGPITVPIRVNSGDDGSIIDAYKYTIHWQNDLSYSEGGSGTSVWIFVPIAKGGKSAATGGYQPFMFLWISYKEENETKVRPMLESFVLKRTDLFPVVSGTPLPEIPFLSTNDWQLVSQNGVTFKIPPDASCDNKTNCKLISYMEQYPNGSKYGSATVSISDYDGGSQREQFLSQNSEVKGCYPIYIEALFVQVPALQIAVDRSRCQYRSGGIVAVIGNKLVTVASGGLYYDPTTEEIYRELVRDTIVSTLKPV